jgi:Holliday junction resolvasome RuvABC ATP-dependent DNA helicase subunit
MKNSRADPVGLNTISTAVGEGGTIEEVYEPSLSRKVI